MRKRRIEEEGEWKSATVCTHVIRYASTTLTIFVSLTCVPMAVVLFPSG